MEADRRLAEEAPKGDGETEEDTEKEEEGPPKPPRKELPLLGKEDIALGMVLPNLLNKISYQLISNQSIN